MASCRIVMIAKDLFGECILAHYFQQIQQVSLQFVRKIDGEGSVAIL
jgi:hypothetical protein